MNINTVIISSTMPRVVFNLRVLADRYFNCRPLVVGKPKCLLPTAPRIDEDTTVGPNHLVNTTKTYDHYGNNLIMVDFGTATTFDVVTHDGAYVGDIIAPNMNLSLQALHKATAALPHVDMTKPAHMIGTNTVACMQSGVFWNYVRLVHGICDQIKAEYEHPMRVISTNELTPLFRQDDTLFDQFDETLTIHGLTVIHQYNKDQSNL